MRVGVVLDTKLRSGGGFQQSLNAILQFGGARPEWLSIEVFTDVEDNLSHPSLAGFPVHFVRSRLWRQLRRGLVLPTSLEVLAARFRLRTRLERAMRDRCVDLVYFVTPSPYALALRSLPYIFTVWDVCHRDHPEFPEVSAFGEFRWRESIYSSAVSQSYLTVTDSVELNRRIQGAYGTDCRRLIAMPFQPAAFADAVDGDDPADVAMRFALPPDYLFYPAQFWPHKNHVRILEALARLKAEGQRYPAVFCGGEPRSSTKDHLQAVAKKLGVADQVFFLGFVDEREMRALYILAKALVMPTYFGPTNLPPMEAWLLDKPVIYSTPFTAQAGDAALFVNPDSAVELADAIVRIYEDKALVETLTVKGRGRLRELENLRSEAEKLLLAELEAFHVRRSCWR